MKLAKPSLLIVLFQEPVLELNRVALSLEEMVLGVTFLQPMLCISSPILSIVWMAACDPAWMFAKRFARGSPA